MVAGQILEQAARSCSHTPGSCRLKSCHSCTEMLRCRRHGERQGPSYSYPELWSVCTRLYTIHVPASVGKFHLGPTDIITVNCGHCWGLCPTLLHRVQIAGVVDPPRISSSGSSNFGLSDFVSVHDPHRADLTCSYCPNLQSGPLGQNPAM